MTATPATATAPQAAGSTAGRDYAPVLRALLRRRIARNGAGRGRSGRANPFRRLAAAVLYGRCDALARPRADHPRAQLVTNTMPFGPVRLAALGLGLAGGGGGSPNGGPRLCPDPRGRRPLGSATITTRPARG